LLYRNPVGLAAVERVVGGPCGLIRSPARKDTKVHLHPIGFWPGEVIPMILKLTRIGATERLWRQIATIDNHARTSMNTGDIAIINEHVGGREFLGEEFQVHRREPADRLRRTPRQST
jgi:hypothetical protein